MSIIVQDLTKSFSPTTGIFNATIDPNSKMTKI